MSIVAVTPGECYCWYYHC